MCQLDDDVVETASSYDFAETVARLVRAIETAGMALFTRIDHRQAARDVGLDMLPATVLVYGNPRGGTPIMRDAPLAALDLPLRVLVRERPDKTVALAYHPVVALLGRAGVASEAAARLEPAQQILSRAVTS